MQEKRFVVCLWMAKAILLIVLICVGFEIVTDRLHLGVVFDPGTASGEQATAAGIPDLPQENETSDYKAILQRNLFTDTDSTDNAPADVNRSHTLDSLPSAQELGLRLIGTIAGGPQASRAIIENTQSKATNSYRIGDTVASATVTAIERNAVVLRHQGRPVVLKLRTGTAQNTEQANGKKPETMNRLPLLSPSDRPSTETGPASMATARAGYMGEILRKATIEPYVKNNRVVGLRIDGMENTPMVRLFGLRNGDVVQSVNGQQLTSKQKAFQVLMKAKTQPQVNIRLLRDGKSKELSFHP